ncbi:MAG: M28 family metallopeptidase [Oceanococcus sp.]
MKGFKIAALLALSLLVGCSTMNRMVQAPLSWVGLGGDKEAAIDEKALLKHISVLASDKFEGRLPGSRGEQRTLEYLVEQFEDAGAEAGNPDGTYLQSVPLAGLTASVDVGVSVNGKPLPMLLHDDISVSSNRIEKLIRVRKSPLVFVGYGVQAPEYQWDDYKGMDMRGKTLLVLVNDPAVRMPGSADLDESMFKGKAMTYYGRWSYKHEIAAKLGADAVLVIHETEPAGYPWGVVAGHSGEEHFTLDAANANSDQVPVKGWIRDGKVRELLALAGKDFDRLKAAAARSDFQPIALPAAASFQVRNTVRKVNSANVVAKVIGTQHPDEYIVYTAHWDHLGRNSNFNGDQIYNGAVDNASGTAGLLELAEVFAAQPPARSVLLLAVTAEEQGLLGARHYVNNPLVPLHKTWANINMDAMNLWGRTADVVLVGKGQNSLELDLMAEAAKQSRRVVAEATPEKGFYFRSDHFEFARKGVPALYARSGKEFVGKDADFGMSKAAQYIAEDYHQVSDEIKPDWDLSGQVADLQLLEQVGRRVANSATPPSWNPKSEFARVRQQRHH